MTAALRQPLGQQAVADPVAGSHLTDTRTRAEVGAPDPSYAIALEERWSFRRMIVVAGAVSGVLWLGLGALVWKAISF